MSITRIAELAGVGVGTVSRYINSSGSVAEDTAKRIAAAMKQTGYKPRVRRPGPKTRERAGVRTGVVLLLTLSPFSPEEMQQMPAFPMLFAGIQSKLLESGMALMFQQVSSGNDLPEMLDPRFCDGVIVLMAGFEGRLSREFLKRLKAMPAVWCFRLYEATAGQFDEVYYDNRIVGAIAADYLHRNGHKRVAFLNAEPRHPAFIERGDTFAATCNDLSLEAESICQAGHQAVADAFVALKRRPTGIFFAADNCMIGTCLAFDKLGVAVSELDMVGCNNEPQFLSLLSPRPPSIDLGFAEIGRTAADRLLARINRTDTGCTRKIVIEPKLVTA